MSVTRIEDITREVITPAGEVQLTARGDGRLTLRIGERESIVQVRRCFPWTEPLRFFSLRDEEDREVMLVEKLDDLEPQSRRVLEQAIAEAGFVFIIDGIDLIEEEFEIRKWRVRTKQGARSFQTARDEWPHDVPGGGLLVRDVAGDLFYIPQPEELDGESQKKLWAFVD